MCFNFRVSMRNKYLIQSISYNVFCFLSKHTYNLSVNLVKTFKIIMFMQCYQVWIFCWLIPLNITKVMNKCKINAAEIFAIILLMLCCVAKKFKQIPNTRIAWRARKLEKIIQGVLNVMKLVGISLLWNVLNENHRIRVLKVTALLKA